MWQGPRRMWIKLDFTFCNSSSSPPQFIFNTSVLLKFLMYLLRHDKIKSFRKRILIIILHKKNSSSHLWILERENFFFVNSSEVAASTLPDLVFYWRRIFLFKKFRLVKIKFHLVGKWSLVFA